MAIVLGLLTTILIGVTAWYAVLTHRMQRTMERQLAAAFQPNIGLGLTNLFRGTGIERGIEREDISGTVIVTNNGDVPVRLVNVVMKVVFADEAFPIREENFNTERRIVMPGQTIDFKHLTVAVPLGSSHGKYEQIAQVLCSDLAGVNTHTFSLSAQSKEFLT